jgi:hypothetical protein
VFQFNFQEIKDIIRKINSEVSCFCDWELTQTESQMIREMGKRFVQGGIDLYVGSTSILTKHKSLEDIISSLTKKTILILHSFEIFSSLIINF